MNINLLEEFPLSENTEARKFKLKGNAFYEAKQFVEALDAYTKAIDLDAKCACFYFNRSAVWFRLKELRKAEEDARKAVELAPRHVSAISRLGLTLIKAEKFDEAAEVYGQAKDLEPSNARVVRGLQRLAQIPK